MTGLLLTRDLFFASKITGTAQQLGLTVETTADVAAAGERIEAGDVGLLILDLELPGLNVAEFVTALPEEQRPTIIAFGPHVRTERLEEARSAGCDEVMPRSRFSAQLPEILRKYLAG